MSIQGEIEFHSVRAMAELDRALDARGMQAAQAHFRLSALHLDRIRELKDRLARTSFAEM